VANLFWKRKGSGTLNLLSSRFVSEEQFESTVFETKGLLEDVYLLRRQVRGGHKSGIPDIVGVDRDGNVCIVEMKNAPVDASILPQVLQYALWAESNPDSIKSLWLQAPQQPEDVTISFDKYEVRIIVIAPSIHPSTLGLVKKIDYEVDLVEIERWVEDGNEFLLVHRLEPEAPLKVRPVRGSAEYNRAFYESKYNKSSVAHFFRYVEETAAFVRQHGWPLDVKFTAYSCGFKHGFFNAFGIVWMGTKTFAFFFKLPQAQARKLTPRGVEMTRYEDQWKQAVFNIEPGKTKVKAFAPLFKAALETVTGKESEYGMAAV
jgi:hypothetical protein